MPTSDNAKIEYEASQSLVDMVALSDDGDQTLFVSADELWSNKAGFVPDVKPDGVVSGFAITPGTLADDIDVAAGTLYQSGVLQPVSASAAEDVARPTLDYIKYSITVNSSQAIVVVAGAEDASEFSTVRGEDGGPPLIAVGSVEIGQVWLSSSSTAIVTASEIKQVQGASQERWDYPSWNQKRINVTAGVISNAGVEFVSALPASHTGAIPKAVFVEYYTPEFAELPNSTDFVPAETTNTVTSTQVYNNTIGASSSSLNQSTFTFYPSDGITDASLKEKNSNLFFRFYQNRLNSAYILQQGIFGISRTFPAGDSIAVAATVSAEVAAVDVFS
ncbi:MAG: hypothetical protein GY941_23720 [Planctomycetes bacterium]|nr:hypothetical protein [Planctomycetota bacterium]